ncbi:GNAT family N-acetyltransferase [soil metagenome]
MYVSATDPLAAPLFTELEFEYSSRYGTFFGENPSEELNRYPAELFQPLRGGAFVLLLRDEAAIAGGAFMRFDDRTVELKRIWASAKHRRQGLARRVVFELEDEARRQGYAKSYLTTGPRQPEAKQLYFSTGYTPLFDPSLAPEHVIIHGFAKALDGGDTDLSGIRAVHDESMAEFRAAHPQLGAEV